MGEPWLVDGISIESDSHINGQLQHAKVSRLLDYGAKAWNKHTLQYLFELEVVELILQAPFSLR